MKTITSKFKIGEELKIRQEPGYTGKVIMINYSAKKYLLDCCPGALGHYDYVWLRDDKGEVQFYAANWFEEKDVYRPRKMRK